MIFIFLFLVVWLDIEAAYGLLFKALCHHSANTSFAPGPPTNYGWASIIVGLVIADLLALCGFLLPASCWCSGAGPGRSITMRMSRFD